MYLRLRLPAQNTAVCVVAALGERMTQIQKCSRGSLTPAFPHFSRQLSLQMPGSKCLVSHSQAVSLDTLSISPPYLCGPSMYSSYSISPHVFFRRTCSVCGCRFIVSRGGDQFSIFLGLNCPSPNDLPILLILNSNSCLQENDFGGHTPQTGSPCAWSPMVA